MEIITVFYDNITNTWGKVRGSRYEYQGYNFSRCFKVNRRFIYFIYIHDKTTFPKRKIDIFLNNSVLSFRAVLPLLRLLLLLKYSSFSTPN